ncbi:MAG: NAD(P)-dependent oxidoreductase [Bdellovibrionota bacterium]
MRYLVTGGGGFLGKAVATRLINDRHDVNSFSRGDYPELKNLGVKCFKGDLTEYKALKKAMSGCDGIFHVAGKAGVWGSYDEYFQANVKGTENVLRGCQRVRH